MGGPGDGRWVEKTDKDIHPEEEFITKQRQNLNPHPSPQEKKEHLSTKGYLLLVLFFFPPTFNSLISLSREIKYRALLPSPRFSFTRKGMWHFQGKSDSKV